MNSKGKEIFIGTKELRHERRQREMKRLISKGHTRAYAVKKAKENIR